MAAQSDYKRYNNEAFELQPNHRTRPITASEGKQFLNPWITLKYTLVVYLLVAYTNTHIVGKLFPLNLALQLFPSAFIVSCLQVTSFQVSLVHVTEY